MFDTEPEFSPYPYPHLTARSILDPEVVPSLYEYLQTQAAWTLHEESFFSQYECVLNADALPATCRDAASDPFLTSLKQRVGGAFGVKFDTRTRIVAHKLATFRRRMGF